jgi:arginase
MHLRDRETCDEVSNPYLSSPFAPKRIAQPNLRLFNCGQSYTRKRPASLVSKFAPADRLPQKRAIELLISNSDLGAGTKGASLGPSALKISAMEQNFPLFQRFPVREAKLRHLTLSQGGDAAAKSIDAIHQRDEELCQLTCNMLRRHRTPIIFSGDHSNANGFISGIREAFPEKKLGVIWIDAHGDIHTPYTTPSGNLHGMPLGALLGLDNQENQVRGLNQETIAAWEALKHTGISQICPKLKPDEVVLLEIRDLQSQEWDAIHQHGIAYCTPAMRKEQGMELVIQQTLHHLQHCDWIFVTFDVDSLDACISEGTGTPSPNGLSITEAKQLLKAFWNLPNLCGLEITEINPLLDHKNAMANTVIDILQSAIGDISSYR